MAMNSYSITLKWGATSTDVEKVIDIKDFPDLMGEPDMLETTTLSDAQVTNIPGIRTSDSMSFTYNYDSATFAKVDGDVGKHLYYELSFPDGSKFTWEGQHTSSIPGKGVNEVLEASVVVAASTPVSFVAASTT
jgi:hypothetical protein